MLHFEIGKNWAYRKPSTLGNLGIELGQTLMKGFLS